MRSMALLFSGQRNKHSCTAGAGTYPKCAIELSNPFTHPGNSDSKRCRAFDLLKLFVAHAVTVVYYFEGHFPSALGQANHYCSPTRVPEYVVDAFLHDAEERSFAVRSHICNLLRRLKLYDKGASFLQTIQVPTQCRY